MADPELADAVWSGTASPDDAPSWYPRVVRIVEAARRRRPRDDADVDRARAAWNELTHRAHVRQRRRRLLVAGAVAVGAALVAGGAAAAMDGGLDHVPFLGSAPAVGDVVDAHRLRHADDGAPGGPPRDVMRRRSVASRPRPASRPASRPAPSVVLPDVLVPEPSVVPPACEPEVAASPGCSERGRHAGDGPADRPAQSPATGRAAEPGAGQQSDHPDGPARADEARDAAPPAARGQASAAPGHAHPPR